MSEEAAGTKRKSRTGDFFSARYFFLRAFVIVVLFAVVHLAGLREYTTFLSGTVANPAVDFRLSAFYGMIYIALYLGTVVVVPILVIAAGLLKFWGQRKKSRTVDQNLR